MSAPSKRFSANRLTRYFVPLALVVLSVGLFVVLVAVIMVASGLVPVG
jgi:hypothetical protein